ncbi:MAG: 6-carboxytetrahydropterin synthase QueD [Planctomycetota bacterium]
MPRLRVSKEFSFDAAHRLPSYRGRCERLHGHTWRLCVTVEGPVHDDGMVLDFGELKRIVDELVLAALDHSYLNDVIAVPSAENVAIWIWQRLAAAVPVPLTSVTVWETPTSHATYSGG